MLDPGRELAVGGQRDRLVGPLVGGGFVNVGGGAGASWRDANHHRAGAAGPLSAPVLRRMRASKNSTKNRKPAFGGFATTPPNERQRAGLGSLGYRPDPRPAILSTGQP